MMRQKAKAENSREKKNIFYFMFFQYKPQKTTFFLYGET